MATSGKTGRKRVTFEVHADPGSRVFIAGSFNDWDSTKKAMKEADEPGVFRGTLLLPKGRHEYKFYINDLWCVDPDCEEWVTNALGTLNSVVHVG